ncbi:MAG: GTP 3',8-cyclase MoaA [Alphaproteobacteria bacterium]
MLDNFGRKVNYVRISVTDRCDLRCKYCMPESNPYFYDKKEILSTKKLEKISNALVKLGIKKIRITGGEPLVRKDIIDYMSFLSKKLKQNKIDELLLTTNGTQLAKYASTLSHLGVKRINVSLDSLISEKFKFITNGGKLDQILEGIFLAREKNISIKINTVLLNKFNDDEIIPIMEWCAKNKFKLSFIEVMPIGEVSSSRSLQYLSVKTAKEIISKKFELVDSSLKSSGPSSYFFCKKLNSYVGFISPISDHFCLTCNRIRITSNGIIYPCLGDNNSVNLNPILETNKEYKLLEVLKNVIFNKPEKHNFNIDEKSYIKKRFMNTTGG